jgi:hypothetical protein
MSLKIKKVFDNIVSKEALKITIINNNTINFFLLMFILKFNLI